MLSKSQDRAQISLFFSLENTLNRNHPLFIPAEKVNWAMLEEVFSPLYCSENGRLAKPIRLMSGLLMLRHVRNLSDESVVEQWAENACCQYFCGRQEFLGKEPYAASELVHFRHSVGTESIGLILRESIRINGDDSEDKRQDLLAARAPSKTHIGKGREYSSFLQRNLRRQHRRDACRRRYQLQKDDEAMKSIFLFLLGKGICLYEQTILPDPESPCFTSRRKLPF